MIATLGGFSNGWALYLLKGKPVFHYTFGFLDHYNIEAPQPLSAGHHTILFDFKYEGGGIGKGGTGTLSVDGQQVAQGRIEHTVAIRYTLNVESFDIGEDTGTPVDTSYEVPFTFTGAIDWNLPMVGSLQHSLAIVVAGVAKTVVPVQPFP